MPRLIAIRLCLVMTLAVLVAACASNGVVVTGPSQADQLAASVGHQFLDDYVDGEGRVVRRDEGGDVVSEGQAYGMLVAAAVGDEPTFRRVWSWTKANLMTSDGHLAWRWFEGVVQDPNSASDADVDAARALLLAGSRFDAPELTADGQQLATAAMAHEVMPMAAASLSTAEGPPAGDGLVLLGGNWAEVPPHKVNPSYFSPRAERDLVASTGDQRWNTLATTHRAVITLLLTEAALPPDWVLLEPDSMVATGHEGEDPVQFGLDAARVPIRLAESCAPEDRALAASMRSTLDQSASPVGIRHLDGSPAVEWKHPIALVASAASDKAAGDDEASRRKLGDAADLQRQYPSYYGAAWVALGYLMLQSNLLGSCSD